MAHWLRQIDSVLTTRAQRPVVGYALALGAVAAATVIELAFKDVFLGNPYHLFWLTVILAAWYGGVGPGIVASLLSVVAVNVLLLPAALSLNVDNLVPIVLFVLSCLFLSWLRQRQLASGQVLARQREQLNAILTSIADGVIAADDNGRVIFINPVGERLLGIRQADAEGRLILDLLTVRAAATDMPARGVTETLLAQRRATSWRRDLVLAAPNRPAVPIDYTVTPLRSPNGMFDGSVVIFRDATDARLVEQRDLTLRQLSLDLSSALTPSDVGSIILKTAEALFGDMIGGVFRVTADGTAIERLASTGTNPAVENVRRTIPLMDSWPITDAVQQNTVVRLESQDEYVRRYPQREAEIRSENVHAVIVLPFEVEQRVIGAMHISFRHPVELREADNSFLLVLAQLCANGLARANLYEREQAARKAAEDANQTKLRFLGMISHELRTPLTSIKGFLSTMLMSDVQWSDQQRFDFLSVVDEETDRLTYLVNQLLDLSRIQAGSFAIRPRPTSIRDILAAVAARLDGLTAHHPLVQDIPDGLPLTMADSERIGQVITNLVGNAAKFSPPDGTIELTARTDGVFVCISVADHGSGIAAADRDKVFEAFRQLGPTSGAGLGLAICKGIVEAHGGRIWIDDDTARGAVIHFTLPVVTTPEPAVEPTGAQAKE